MGINQLRVLAMTVPIIEFLVIEIIVKKSDLLCRFIPNEGAISKLLTKPSLPRALALGIKFKKVASKSILIQTQRGKAHCTLNDI